MTDNDTTVYEMIGGEEIIRKLVDVFYAKVEADDDLRAIFPDDLEPGKHWQFLFLMQYWGGPRRYGEQRGHPRLRMRHAPYSITPHLRNLWVKYMLEAIDEMGIQDPSRAVMRRYFEHAASVMVNQFQQPPDGSAS